MIRDEKKTEVEEEIRRQVDNLMREELDLLKAVIIIDLQEKMFILNSSPLRGTRERRVKSVRSVKRERKEARRERRRRTRT